MCIYNTDQTSLIGGLVSIRCLFTQTGYIWIVQTITQTRGVTCLTYDQKRVFDWHSLKLLDTSLVYIPCQAQVNSANHLLTLQSSL